MSAERILIIRFSSFGDVTQALSIPSVLRKRFPDSEIHWVTREDMAPLLQNHPAIQRVWKLSRREGFAGLWQLGRALRQEKFSRIYDAHNNLRSRVLSFIIRAPFVGAPRLLRRSIRRWKRFFLFRLRLNFFRMPFSGQRDLLEPLKKWDVDDRLPPVPQIFLSETETRAAEALVPKVFVALAPSAAFPLKRWPLESWRSLMNEMPGVSFVLLGGPEDNFLQDLVAVDPQRVINLAGRTNLRESAAVISLARALVSNDTGLLHVGEQLGIPTVALMGPAPFGFPSRPTTRVRELQLPCRPCSKHGQGPCVNPVFQLCLRGIRADSVAEDVRAMAGL